MKPETKNWLKIARYDLSAAKACLKSKFYLKVFENCHAAIENLLKGIITENTRNKPPKIHNLLRLVSIALLENLEKETKSLFDDLNNIYIATRCPKDFEELQDYLSKDKAIETYKKVERIFKWLEKKSTKSKEKTRLLRRLTY